VGVFYPEGLPPASYLSFYAGHFPVTEINTSFYRLPKPSTISNWVSVVPGRFRFCPKISRYITHVKKLNDPELILPRFFDIFEPIKKRLGPILIQLPDSVAFHIEKADPFFKILHDTYSGYRFALEIRHPSWMEEEALHLLKNYHIAWVIAESGGRWPSAEIVTDKHIYLRFHGPNGYYDTSYPDRVLRECARKCREWAASGHTVWVFFNNDGHGYAIENARTLRELTG
jgi:uncharacterized protein YecE (DUF72 family)